MRIKRVMMKTIKYAIICLIVLFNLGMTVVISFADTEDYSPCRIHPNNAYFFEWKIGIFQGGFQEGNYTHNEFYPGRNYLLMFKWKAYSVCDQLHGYCIHPLDPEPDPPMPCPTYVFEDDVDEVKKTTFNRCAKVIWTITKQGASDGAHNFEDVGYYAGDLATYKIDWFKPGIYTITAVHSGWSDCQNENNIEFENIQGSYMPSLAERTHSFELTLNQLNPAIDEPYTEFSISGLGKPHEAITSVFFNGKWLAYTNGDKDVYIHPDFPLIMNYNTPNPGNIYNWPQTSVIALNPTYGLADPNPTTIKQTIESNVFRVIPTPTPFNPSIPTSTPVPQGVSTPTPTPTPSIGITPGASGQMFSAFHAQYPDKIDIPPAASGDDRDDWYSRMAPFHGVFVEKNGSTDVAVHAFYHSEDTHDINGQYYGYVGSLHINYTRIGYARSFDGYHFDHVDASKIDPTITPTHKSNFPRNPQPLIESFMSEAEWRQPNLDIPIPTKTNNPNDLDYEAAGLEHGPGVRHPWAIEHTIGSTEYVYVFYDRIISNRYAGHIITPTPLPTNPGGIPPIPTYTPHPKRDNLIKSMFPVPTSKEELGYSIEGTICVARALKSDLANIDSLTPGSMSIFKNYFDGDFIQDSIGGWSSPVIIPRLGIDNDTYSREAPTVTRNEYLNKFTMLSFGQVNDSNVNYHTLHLYVNKSNDLTEWYQDSLRIDLGEVDGISSNFVARYCMFVNGDNDYQLGSIHKMGETGYLYFSNFETQKLARVGFEFNP